MSFIIRDATKGDLSQVCDIFEYYVLNTVLSFLVQKPPPDLMTSRFDEITARRLPYLVAVDKNDQVVGYAYAAAFRGYMLGYGHTVEISLFCHPQYTNKGVGSQMIQQLLDRLRSTKHLTRENGHEDSPAEHNIRKVMAIMAVDENAPGRGLALRDWYVRWGFEQVGRLKGVGFKKDTTIDTIYLELHLDSENR